MRRPQHVLSAILFLAAAGLVGGTSPALADLAHGTPLVACTAPTLNTDGTTIPTTGSLALKEFRFYVDAQTTFKTSTFPNCGYQYAVGDIPAGAHSLTATAVNNAGQESARSNSLPFVLPAPSPTAPAALQIQ